MASIKTGYRRVKLGCAFNAIQTLYPQPAYAPYKPGGGEWGEWRKGGLYECRKHFRVADSE
jgi:hypothetical protein